MMFDFLTKWTTWIVILLAGSFLGLIGGCADQQKNQNVLTFLQEGKAEGHLVVTSNAVAGGELYQGFRLGADDMSVGFDGSIDFADNVRHVTDDE
jgi:hypothetical protein